MPDNEKYINRGLFGELEFSDQPDSFMQSKYRIEDHPFMPGVKQAYDATSFSVVPSFDIETDLLGHHHLTPPSNGFGYSGGYSGAYASSRSKPEPIPHPVHWFFRGLLSLVALVPVALVLYHWWRTDITFTETSSSVAHDRNNLEHMIMVVLPALTGATVLIVRLDVWRFLARGISLVSAVPLALFTIGAGIAAFGVFEETHSWSQIGYPAIALACWAGVALAWRGRYSNGH